MAAPKRYRVQPPLSGQDDFQFGSDGALKEWVFLGKPAEFGQTKRILFDIGGEHVVAVVGKRGSGKSFTLGSLAESLATKEGSTSIGSHKRRFATLLFDTLNIYPYTEVPVSATSDLNALRGQAQLLAGWPIAVEPLDVTVWTPAGHKWPGMLPHYREFSLSCVDLTLEDLATTVGLDTSRDPQGQLLADLYEVVSQRGLDYDPSDLERAIDEDHAFLAVYHDETVRAVRRHLRMLARDGLFVRRGTSLAEFLRPGNLAVLMTNQLPDDLRSVLAAVLLRKVLSLRAQAAFAQKQLLLNDRLSAADRLRVQSEVSQSIPPIWILIDEAQNLIPSGHKTGASEALIQVVREGRNSGISVVVTTQQPSAIDQRILAQVDTLLVHQLVTQPDIDAVKRNQKSNDPTELKYGDVKFSLDEVVRSLGVGQCLVSSTDAARWFICTARPRISAHGGLGAATADS